MLPLLNSFTFQSGDIQISNPSDVSFWISLFTFQSGDIQIESTFDPVSFTIENLHSNLVIFKCDGKHWNVQEIFNLHSNLVIFK